MIQILLPISFAIELMEMAKPAGMYGDWLRHESVPLMALIIERLTPSTLPFQFGHLIFLRIRCCILKLCSAYNQMRPTVTSHLTARTTLSIPDTVGLDSYATVISNTGYGRTEWAIKTPYPSLDRNDLLAYWYIYGRP